MIFYQLSIDGIPQYPLFKNQNDRDKAVTLLLAEGVPADSFGAEIPYDGIIDDLHIPDSQKQLMYYSWIIWDLYFPLSYGRR